LNKSGSGVLFLETTTKTLFQFFSTPLGPGKNLKIPGDGPCSISEHLFLFLSLFIVFVFKGNGKEEIHRKKTLNSKPIFQAYY